MCSAILRITGCNSHSHLSISQKLIRTTVNFLIFCGVSVANADAFDTPYLLEQAVQVALAQDPVLAKHRAMVSALQQQTVAKAQLPDPNVRFALANFPTDTFDRAQEPMTQITVGVQQMIPRGETLALEADRSGAMVYGQLARVGERELMLVQSVRSAWLELHYWLQAATVIRQNLELFNQLVQVTQYQYGTGRRNQQDVVRAQLEMDLLQDRLRQIQSKHGSARADLVRLIGAEELSQSLSEQFPQLPLPPKEPNIRKNLPDHPLMRLEQAEVQVKQHEVELARQAYKPSLMLDLSYGNREDRPDFLSAAVMMDIPLFTDKRQDRRLEQNQQQLKATQYARDDRLRELKQQLAAQYSEWQYAGHRLKLYEANLLKAAKQNSEVSLTAYQSGASEFESLMRARITDLNTQLQYLRIRVDHAKTQSKLLYLAGEKL